MNISAQTGSATASPWVALRADQQQRTPVSAWMALYQAALLRRLGQGAFRLPGVRAATPRRALLGEIVGRSLPGHPQMRRPHGGQAGDGVAVLAPVVVHDVAGVFLINPVLDQQAHGTVHQVAIGLAETAGVVGREHGAVSSDGDGAQGGGAICCGQISQQFGGRVVAQRVGHIGKSGGFRRAFALGAIHGADSSGGVAREILGADGFNAVGGHFGSPCLAPRHAEPMSSNVRNIEASCKHKT